MKKGWIITLVLICGVFFVQQSVKVIAQYNDINHQCATGQHNNGWDKLNSSISSYNQQNIDVCINDSTNSEKWCCVCFEEVYPTICSQLFTVLSGTPVVPSPSVTTEPTNTPTPIPTSTSIEKSISNIRSSDPTLPTDLGTGGFRTNNTSADTGLIFTLSSYSVAPTSIPTPSPIPTIKQAEVKFSVLNLFSPPTPSPIPTAIPRITPLSYEQPTVAPTSSPSMPIPTAKPESFIPSSLTSQKSTTSTKTSYTLNTGQLESIKITANAVSVIPTDKPFVPEEQRLLANNTPSVELTSGITVALQQKTGSEYVTQQDELTVKRGNQFFSISNQGTTTQKIDSQPTSVQQNKSSNADSSSKQLEINANNVIAFSNMGLSIDPLSGILTVDTPNGPQKVSIMPDEALGIVVELKALNANGVVEPTIRLVSEGGALIYRISGEKVEKFLGFFPLSIQKQILVSADTGSIVKVELSLIAQILSFFTF